MAITLKATKEGLAKVDLARRKKGWNADAVAWVDAAQTAPATLRRFRQGKRIQEEVFKKICQAVGVNWEEVVDNTIDPPTTQTAESTWLLLLSATLNEVDRQKAEAFIELANELLGNPFIALKRIDPGSVVLVLESCLEAFERIEYLFKTKQLTEILGVRILAVRLQSATAPINWRQWLQNLRDEIFEPYWQQPQLVLGTGAHKGAMSPYEIEPIAPLIQRLQTTNDEITRRQIATELGDIGVNSPEAIAALTDLLATSEDSETLWQAALSLGKINPSHPQAGIEMAKAIDLVSETESVTVALLIAFRPKNEQKVSIRIRIEAIDEENDLPENLQVIVFDRSGNTFRQAQPTNPTFLELQGFSGSVGEQFSIRLSLGEVSITENFVI
jgi:hypothetical protein